jgi:Large polyvalent protein-associated domain 7
MADEGDKESGSSRDSETEIDAIERVPADIKSKFTQEGRRYHFKDGALAFTDRGNRITSASENTEVIKSVIAIAKERGWREIAVSGTERFRREALVAARLVGIEVRGHTRLELQQLREGKRAPEQREYRGPSGANRSEANVTQLDASRPDGLHVGVLLQHGHSPYKHDENNSPSYFVRLKTAQGERELWGIDLARAIREGVSTPKIGDEVGVRAIRRETVKVWAQDKDAEGNLTGERRLETHRNAWVVERIEYFRSREQAANVLLDIKIDERSGVARHAELVGPYLQLRAAELAAKEFKNPQDRHHFVKSVRVALADSIARGEPLAPVRLKEAALERLSVPVDLERTPDLVR